MMIKYYFMRNGTILTLRIIPNCQLYIISYQIPYNVAVCTVGTLKSLNCTFFRVWPFDDVAQLEFTSSFLSNGKVNDDGKYGNGLNCCTFQAITDRKLKLGRAAEKASK